MNKILRLLGTEWDRKLSAGLWAIFLYQYVHWLSQQKYNGLYWLEPSIWSAQVSLVLVALMEMALHVRRWLRHSLEFVVVFIVHLIVMDYTPIWVPIDSLDALQFVVHFNFIQLNPYIWFGFAVSFVYVVVSFWTSSKGKILFVIMTSIILFSIVDSFSKVFYFWDQVAYMVFCGLLLMIIRHFAEFQVKHPGSWQWLKEYPAKIAVPIAILIAVIVFSGMIAPNSRPFLTDPYTAWKSMQGERVVSLGKGFGDSIRLAAPERSTESGYSRNDDVIGGGFNYDYSEVMTVSTSHRSYWRGEVRSLYTGEGWEQGALDTYGTEVLVDPDQALIVQEQGIDLSKRETVEVTQTVSMSDDETYPVLFGAFAPNFLTSINNDAEQFDYVVWRNHHSELRWDEEQAEDYPDTYQLVSEMPVIDEEGLRQSGTVLPPELAEFYLQLPPTVTQRVKDLAVSVTAEADNAFDRMKLLELYLKTEFIYTNTPDTQLGDGDDFVDDFLFEIQQGYCDYYSTAMIVMARSLGVPARWVKGYSSGISDVEMYMPDMLDQQMMENPEGSGTYTVRNSDAHSWVEVYFEGYGWIPFEPTASFTLPLVHETPPTDVVLPDLDSSDSTGDAGSGETGGGVSWLQAVAVGLFVLALVGGLMFWKRRSLSLRWYAFRRGSGQIGSDEARIRIIHEFDRFMRYARRKGFERREYETVRETLMHWSSRGTWLKPQLDLLLNLFEKAKYSGQTVGAEELQEVRQVLDQLRTAMK